MNFRPVLLIFLIAASAFSQESGLGGLGSASSYDGPAILGRGNTGVGITGKDRAPIRAQISVNGSYDTGIAGYSIGSDGKLEIRPSAGADVNAGVIGQKRWGRSYVGINYTGSYAHYNQNTFYNGFNQTLGLSYGRRLSRRWELQSQIGAGTSNQFLGNGGAFLSSEVELLNLPVSELFNSRVYYLTGTTSVIYSADSRNSFRIGGTGNTVRRKARGLIDIDGYSANGDWVHRVNKRFTVGVSYSFSHYDFKKVFGESDIHSLGIHLSRRIGRDWEVKLGALGFQQSTVGVREIQLDPVLSALLGRSSGREVFESNNFLYGYDASVSRKYHRSQASISAGRGATPGNGIFLTSINNTAGFNFNYTASQKASVNSSLSYNKLSSLGFASGTYSGWSIATGGIYKVRDAMGVNLRYEYRTFDLQGTALARSGSRISLGLTYTPSRELFNIW